ncbi:hypothetical protein ACGFYQ_30040 [Streptomyces sp. NPDC048258]|uniref:hypothetical protein n=1 Tax=Streptomyces sp. NPDC048258 TaxID=3365527 RepID=UPI003713088E
MPDPDPDPDPDSEPDAEVSRRLEEARTATMVRLAQLLAEGRTEELRALVGSPRAEAVRERRTTSPPPRLPKEKLAPFIRGWHLRMDEASDMVDVSPSGGVLSAWQSLRLLGLLILDTDQRALSGEYALANALAALGYPPDVVDILKVLERLRDVTVHSRGEAVTAQSARDFIAGCRAVGDRLLA